MIFFGQANAFADVALWLWFAVALIAFLALKPQVATAVTLLGGRMFLPEGVAFKLPVLPDLDKYSIPSLAAFLGCLVFARKQLLSSGLKPKPFDRWFLILLAGHVGTLLTNRDLLQEAVPALPALTAYDLLTTVCEDLVLVYLTFICARAMFGTPNGLRTLLLVTAVLGLLYTPLCGWERVMGPNLHFKLYGFYQHSLDQTLRHGLFRPMVFMSHGLVVGRLLLVALLAAAVLLKARAVHRAFALPLVWLLWVLIACKSVGAIVLGLAALPLALFASAKLQARAAAALALIVLLYPLLRGADVFPVETLIDTANQYSAERAISLASRFEQEDALLEKARQRLAFGWGVYARSHVYDPETGEDVSVTDGEWIITLGSRGLVGFLAWYALYLWPTFSAWRTLKRLRLPQHRALIAGTALINALLAVDTLPNAQGSLPHVFFAGALAGATYGVLRHERLARLRAAWQRRIRRAPKPGTAAAEAEPVPAGAVAFSPSRTLPWGTPHARG